MKSWINLVGPSLLSAGLLIVSGCNRDRAKAGGPPPMSPPLVTVSEATSKDVPVYLDEIGKCAALESVTITPQVAGIITERHFEDGADLKQGQVLFTIDPPPYKAALDAANAQLAQAKASQNFAKLELDRYTAIANTKAISKSDFDTKKNAMDVADAQFEAAQAAVETAQLNLNYCTIRSPIDGRAGARLVDAGNVVKANEGSLLLVQHLDPIYADFTITERDLPEVQKQMAAGKLKALAKLPADPGDGRAGELTFLDNAVQDGTGTVKLRANIPNSDHHFWPGQFLDVRLILTIAKGAVVVPNESTQISQQGPYVYVMKPDSTADLRPVALGQRQGSDVVITKGVSAGERVIMTGQLLVRPGGPVRVDTSGKPPVGAPGMPTSAPGAEAGDDQSTTATEGGKQ